LRKRIRSMDDVALDIGLRQGLMIEDDVDASFFGEFDDDDEEALAILEETEEFGDDFGGDPDTVSDQLQEEFDGKVEAYSAIRDAYLEAKQQADELGNAFLEAYNELHEWMDEHLEEGDLPVWVDGFEDTDLAETV
jgi:hypothetical protein